MKLYKYRDFSNPCDADFQRLATVLTRQTFWCARPDTLNDPEEFSWRCDYQPTSETIGLVTELLVQVVGRSREEARRRATSAVEAGRLEAIAQPSIAEMIKQCRNEIGLACFGTALNNEVLWQRYGGAGAGVCIEVDVPDSNLKKSLYLVDYADTKRIHIDQLIRSFIDRNHVWEVYELALLLKPSYWAPEKEIRFVSKMQSVSVAIGGSRITRLILGDILAPVVRERLILAVPKSVAVLPRSDPSGA